MAYQFDFSSINVDNMRVLGEGMLLSLEITGTAILVGIVWGTLLAMMRLSGIKPLQVFGQAYVNLFRSIPLVMVLLWFFLLIPLMTGKPMG
ncbi:MAG: ABC transporter permease subunit, partial [Ralstonia sp.]